MVRVHKYLSEQGLLSRRKAEEYIRAGKILINGKPATIGAQIDPAKDKVEVIGQAAKSFESILIYKPREVASSSAKAEGKTIYDLFPQYKHLHIAGRLDKDSEGLLILTNDGILAKQLTGASHPVEKEYEVFVQEKVRGPELGAMQHGVRLKDGMTLPATVEKTGPHSFKIALREGRNHQIRRMADKVHLTVTRLVRKRIGTLTSSKLKNGQARALTAAEVQLLKEPASVTQRTSHKQRQQKINVFR